MDKIRDQYKNLLLKFANDNELTELFNEVVIDFHRENELYYNKHGKYKDKQDLVGKLKYDLFTTKKYLEGKKCQK